MAAVHIRRFQERDATATARIFFDAVRVGAQAYYDDAQRRAWAPAVPKIAGWLERIWPQTALVAEHDGRVVGFMTLTKDGSIDLAYVAPDRIGQGVAKQLYDALLAVAVERGLPGLRVEASHLARGFFERQGWEVTRQQTVRRGGVAMTNFVMTKKLA